MTLKSKIDFMEVYAVEYVEGRRVGEFKAELADGSLVRLRMEVSGMVHELLPHVYNLAFGPVDGKGKINAHSRLIYKSRMKVFSTVLLFVEEYLRAHPRHYIGIDGSGNARAELYYRGWQRNFDYLSAYMKLDGIKFFVRIARIGREQYHNPFDFEDVQWNVFPVNSYGRPAGGFMYNYFVVYRDGYYAE
jgi:hypothetical protein